MTLGKKQSITHEEFVACLNGIGSIVSQSQYQQAKAIAAGRIASFCNGKRVAFGWSGGKDSIALRAVCEAAGVHRCVFGMTDGLEYPAFLEWVTNNMPPQLSVLKNGWDLDWLAAHQDMLFPRDSNIAAKWFKGIQHAAQERYYKKQWLGCIILGRRRVDGNYISNKPGQLHYTAGGVCRFSPIADWSHELVLASIFYEGYANNLPPFYHWPRGFRCGTHAWAARQWCKTIQSGWAEVYSIDPSIVIAASSKIESAAKFMEGL